MKSTSLTLCAFGALAIAWSVPAAAQWPERPVTIIVPAGAGGGTDATARLLSVHLEEIFGQPFNVVNQGEGGGLVGILNTANADPDGYTLGIVYNYAHYDLLGQAELSWESFTPIAQYNFDPAGFNVAMDSPYQTLEEALDAMAEDPSSFDVSCGGSCGTSWHLALASLLLERGIDPMALNMVPAQGAAAGLQEMVAGNVDVVPCSVPEAGALIDAGRVRALAILSDQRLGAFPDVPTVVEELGISVEGGAWRSMAGPAGLPEDIVAQLAQAMDEIVHDQRFVDAMNERGFGIRYRNTEELIEFMQQHEADTAAALEGIGAI
ncbi:MAG: tripartite tricarboxylate transporter substrate binding protein [Azospirillaceae bacterium]